MKPRPTFATFFIPPQLSTANISVGCRRNGHIRSLVPALGIQCRDNWKWRISGDSSGTVMRQWEGYGRRHASSDAAAAARKTAHRTTIAPSTASKPSKASAATKSSVKAKAKPSSRYSSPPITVPARTSTPKRTTAPTLRAKESLNPPDFTYAAEIIVPARKSGQNLVSYLWGAGRVYLSFYKTGISNVWQTSKLAKQLREKAAKHPGQNILTRAEWQIVRRSRRDMLRLPAFGLLVLCLGEWLPLVALYITPLIPEACRIPQQVDRTLRKMEDKRADRLRRVGLDAARLIAKDRRPAGAGMDINMHDLQSHAKLPPTAAVTKNVDPDQMTYFDLMLFSATHDCHARIWDWLFLTPPKLWLRADVKKKLQYLTMDDQLIERDGGWAALGSEEVRRACVDRGITVVGKKEEELRRALSEQWVGGRV